MTSIIRSAPISATTRVLRKREEPNHESVYHTDHSARDSHLNVRSSAPSASDMSDTMENQLASLKLQLAAEREKAEVEIRQLKESAKKEGYADGKNAAEIEVRDVMLAMQKELSQHSTVLHTVRAELLEKSEDDIVHIVYAACCKMMGELAVNPSAVSIMVKDLLAASNERSIEVYLHPDDLEAVLQHLSHAEKDGVKWREDPTIKLGGCLVESADGTLDARLETQLASLRDVLISARKQRLNTPKGK